MKKIVLVCAIVAGAALSQASFAAPAAEKYTVEDTALGDLLDNPSTRAILDKYIPGLTSSGQIDMARGMTLKSIQQFAPDTVTDDALNKVETALAKIPVTAAK